jgi:hypothetical protein
MAIRSHHRTGRPAFVGDAAYEILLRQLATCDPADRAVARSSPAIEQCRVEWLNRMRLALDAYDDGLNARAAGYLRQAAESHYAAGDLEAELATVLEAAGDAPISSDLRYPENEDPSPRSKPVAVPAPIRKAAGCTQLELVA